MTDDWPPPDEGGRTSGPPVPPAERPFDSADAVVRGELASFLLRGFEPGVTNSRAEGRWLAPGLGPFQDVEVAQTVVVTEGSQPVARFHVTEVLGR